MWGCRTCFYIARLEFNSHTRNPCKARIPEKFFSSEIEENIICTAVQNQESCPAQFPYGNRDLTSIQNVSVMLCPYKVTQLWSHLAEKNNQHTPETFLGYCTGTTGFRNLLSSSHIGTQLCAPDGLIQTLLPHLLCSRDSHQNPRLFCQLKSMRQSSSFTLV